MWHKREYKDVDLGCIVVNEDVVLERTRRDHVSTQPYNQVAASHVVDLGAPTSIFDLSGMDYSEAELPCFAPIVWVRSMDMPVMDFALLLWHGEHRAGDMTSWMLELSNKLIMPYPIDLVIGGQEHNLARAPIKSAVLHMGESEHCRAFFMQCTCSPFSASRFEQPGPPILFDLDNVDGIPDEDGELPLKVMQALNDAKFCAEVFRLTADNDKVAVLEYPASQGTHSPFSAKGRELHSTIADTTIISSVIAELKLATVYTEQGASGAASRKPTSLLCTANAAHALRRTVGTLFVKPNTKFESILGADADGVYKTKVAGRYTPLSSPCATEHRCPWIGQCHKGSYAHQVRQHGRARHRRLAPGWLSRGALLVLGQAMVPWHRDGLARAQGNGAWHVHQPSRDQGALRRR